MLVVALAITLSGCGGGDGSGASATTASPEETTEAPAASAAEEAAPAGGELVLSNYENYMPEDLIPAFEKETGIKVTVVNHATNEEIVGKMEASNGDPGFDLAVVAGPFAEAMTRREWLAEIDHSKIPNLENLAPEAEQLSYDPGNTRSVPYTWGTTGICYRSDLVSEPVDSWADLLMPADELKGKITMVGSDRWLLLPALKYLGYSANTTDQAELEEARDLLRETKESLLAYDDTTFFSRLVAGEAWLVEAWDGWCNYAIAENADVEWVVPKEGSDIWADVFVIPEASENKDAAQAFIDFVLRPEVHKTVAELVYYNVPNPEAMAMIDPALLEQFDNLGIPSAELFAGNEPLRDVSEAGPVWSRIVSEIKTG